MGWLFAFDLSLYYLSWLRPKSRPQPHPRPASRRSRPWRTLPWLSNTSFLLGEAFRMEMKENIRDTVQSRIFPAYRYIHTTTTYRRRFHSRFVMKKWKMEWNLYFQWHNKVNYSELESVQHNFIIFQICSPSVHVFSPTQMKKKSQLHNFSPTYVPKCPNSTFLYTSTLIRDLRVGWQKWAKNTI